MAKSAYNTKNKISWSNRLNTRFQLTLILVLLVAFASSQYLLFSKQKASIYQEEVERAAFMADGLSRSLQTLMLSGNAEYATDWIERVSKSPELLIVQVIRKNHYQAFLDGKTLDAVNSYLDENRFSRALKPAKKITDLDPAAFAKAVAGNEFSKLDEASGKLTFLLPIRARNACMGCHGYDQSKVRGILRITTSVAHAQQRISRALHDTIVFGISVALLIGLLLFLFIRRQILIPLEQVAEATADIAAGNLETRINMRNKSEIGMLGDSFNHMTDALKNSTVSREYFETIMSSMGEMLFVTDSEHKIQLTNPAVLATLGYQQHELKDKPLDALIDGGIELSAGEEKRLADEGEIKSIERKFLHKDGHSIPVLITVSMMQYGENNVCQIIHAGRDITRQKRIERDLSLAAKVMESDSNAIMICDHQANILLVNPAFCVITGYSRDEVIGRNPRILSSGRQSAEFYRNLWDSLLSDGAWAGEIWNKRKDGGVYPERLSISAVCNDAGEITNYVSIFNDISEQKDIELRLSHMAHHDQLTGLPNRTLFIDRLEHALAHASRNKDKVGLMFIDIDGFKAVNDNHGHDVGDALLCIIANSLTELVRDADTVARIGGDEFVIILEKLLSDTAIIQVAEKILNRFSVPTLAAGIACDIGCSIGITIGSDDSSSCNEIVKQADTAMYLAKTSGKQQYRIYGRDCVAAMEL
ncbi:diguanylate cyclase domain-containing protein [Mariprofundus ferrooxydans]|uniref:Hypothetical 918 kDa protein Y4LL n=1 Tax=Mariprofundus ferrooxydans PV-1 TaxID=314345 RepID=Q0F206_9PROT|nr:diguanylate cyclase [Mariprofundus ferrooxydans]EAU55744.1 Hypothetical 918 kDa protein Y4LL [Mariprofundus ferrooxydans PV-1]